MSSPLSALGVTLPVIAAPMAGGPTTVDMVLAAHGRDPSEAELAASAVAVGTVLLRSRESGASATHRAPLGYPAIHHLTSPLRKAAAAAGQPDLVHLWAGTGYRHATEESTGQTLARLAAAL